MSESEWLLAQIVEVERLRALANRYRDRVGETQLASRAEELREIWRESM